jgi:hypothetical protein
LSSVNIWRCSLLQRVAEAHGSASAKEAKSVLHGAIGSAVDNGVLSNDATRQVRTVTSTAAKSKERDHTRRGSPAGVESRTGRALQRQISARPRIRLRRFGRV